MKGLVVENQKVVMQDSLKRPVPKSKEVLVKVAYASINPTDLENIEGKYDFWLKILGGNYPVKTGLEFSGEVMQDGNRFQKNDKVFGYVDLMKGLKTHQEYISINEDCIALMPKNLHFQQAAALPLGALTTLVGLQDVAKVNSASNVLINGASGGLGVYAVQIAKLLGAFVTAVAGAEQDKFLTELGADEVFNYRDKALEESKQKFDLFFDLSNKKNFSQIKHLLTAKGVFIPAEPNRHILDVLLSYFTTKKTKSLLVPRGNHQKLSQIAKWVEEEKLQVLVDSLYNFSEYQQAFDRLQEKGRRGRIVLKINEHIS
ncbi:MAG: NAD(P)-dependent alcohol dehydrogenase [Spirochaetota bacterium]